MNKEFLDYLYEERFKIRTTMDKLIETRKNPITQGDTSHINREGMIGGLRDGLYSIDVIIEKYITLKNS